MTASSEERETQSSQRRIRRADGVFSLVTNDRSLTAEEVLRAYKRQPISRHRLETNGGSPQDLYTDPTPLQSQIIKLFGFTEINYGRKK